jgi:hypothetical protein
MGFYYTVIKIHSSSSMIQQADKGEKTLCSNNQAIYEQSRRREHVGDLIHSIDNKIIAVVLIPQIDFN